MNTLNAITTHGIGRLPVVKKESGRIIGIMTRADAIKAYGKAVESIAKSEPTGRGAQK